MGCAPWPAAWSRQKRPHCAPVTGPSGHLANTCFGVWPRSYRLTLSIQVARALHRAAPPRRASYRYCGNDLIFPRQIYSIA
jgi:hypothetical protein